MYRCFVQFSSLTSVTVQVTIGLLPLPGALASSRTERARPPLPPWHGLGLLWNSKGQRLFLAGAEVQIQARDGGGDKRQATSCGCAAFGPEVAVEPLGSWIPRQWKTKGLLNQKVQLQQSLGQVLKRPQMRGCCLRCLLPGQGHSAQK